MSSIQVGGPRPSRPRREVRQRVDPVLHAARLLVELAGLPGSGKSTAVTQIVATRPGVESVVVDPGRLRDLVKPALLVGTLAGWIRFDHRSQHQRGVLRLVRCRARQNRLTDSGGNLLLEEGMTHHVWRELFLTPELKRIPWQGLLNDNFPLVALDVEVNLLKERVLGKARPGPVNRYLASASDDIWNHASGLYAEIIEEASRRRPVVRVQSGGSIDATVDSIYAAMKGQDAVEGSH